MVHIERYQVGQSNNESFSDDNNEIEQLREDLIARTRELMGISVRHHLIAFSGGVDSSLVAAVLHHCQSDQENVRAVLGISPAVPQEQVDLARQVAEHIGIGLTELKTSEGSDATYIENAGQACFACKTHLYSTLETVVSHASKESGFKIYNGTNADDLQDPTRVGLLAAQNFQVLSPLEILTKQQVRTVARSFGLPNWNYAASPCLRSRLALGVKAIPKDLGRIEQAERHVRLSMSETIDETTNLRVRLFAGNRACIEIDERFLEQASAYEWDTFFLQKLDFSSVEIRSFRSGSVARKTAAITNDRDR